MTDTDDKCHLHSSYRAIHDMYNLNFISSDGMNGLVAFIKNDLEKSAILKVQPTSFQVEDHICRDAFILYYLDYVMKSKHYKRDDWSMLMDICRCFLIPIVNNNDGTQWLLYYDQNYINPKEFFSRVLQSYNMTCDWTPCIMSTAVNSPISLSKLIRKKLFNGEYLVKLEQFYKKLITFTCATNELNGFCHNDMHAGNVLYDSELKSFVLIDYGRSYVDYTQYSDLTDHIIKELKIKINIIEDIEDIFNSTYKSVPLNKNNMWADLAGLSQFLINHCDQLEPFLFSSTTKCPYILMSLKWFSTFAIVLNIATPNHPPICYSCGKLDVDQYNKIFQQNISQNYNTALFVELHEKFDAVRKGGRRTLKVMSAAGEPQNVKVNDAKDLTPPPGIKPPTITPLPKVERAVEMCWKAILNENKDIRQNNTKHDMVMDKQIQYDGETFSLYKFGAIHEDKTHQ